MKKSLFSIVIIVILGLIVSGCIAPLESVIPTSEKGNPKPELTSPIIRRGVFTDYGYSSPPWYPPSEETKSYRWAPRIYWVADDLPIDITVYTANEPIADTFGPIQTGFTSWDKKTGTPLYGSFTEEEDSGSRPGVVLDGENTVQWAPIDGPSGIIGVTYYWYYTATKEMIEFDIVLDKDETWATVRTSTAFDVQNIATHEAGHTLGLKDLRSPKDGALTMHAYTWTGDDSKRTLGSGDILGIQKIYGK
jgi:hypothetical protein